MVRRSCVLLCKQADGVISFPRFADLLQEPAQWIYLFSIGDDRFYWLNQRQQPVGEPFAMDEHLYFAPPTAPGTYAYAGLVGFQLHNWYNRHRYCGRCGTPLQPDSKERMMRCPQCDCMSYPQICPAVIIGLTHGDKILLSKYKGRNYKDYALLAGFCRSGRNHRRNSAARGFGGGWAPAKKSLYYKSQPWPPLVRYYLVSLLNWTARMKPSSGGG